MKEEEIKKQQLAGAENSEKHLNESEKKNTVAGLNNKICEGEKINDKKAKTIIESVLFINERPIQTKELMRVLGKEKKETKRLAEELIEEYQQQTRGICVVKVAGGYQMCSSPENEPWIKKMYREKNKQKLSVASLETLAIIAYKQPITRMEIETIRGVNAGGVVKKLTDLGLVKIGGRKEVIGRPFLYITTRKFLEYFGLNSLKDLPKLEEFVNLAENDQVIQEVAGKEKISPSPEKVQTEPTKGKNSNKEVEE